MPRAKLIMVHTRTGESKPSIVFAIANSYVVHQRNTHAPLQYLGTYCTYTVVIYFCFAGDGAMLQFASFFAH